jgi:hypothetical protein
MKIFSILLSLTVSLTFLACAKPNYAEAQNQSGSGANGANSKLNTQCPYELTKFQTCVDLQWVNGPKESEEGIFQLKFWNQSGVAVDPEKSLSVILWMPDMGHGSSPVTLQKTALGAYTVSKVYFIMSGAWEIRVQIKEGKNVLDQVIVPVSIK